MLLAPKAVGTFVFLCRDYFVWLTLSMVFFPTRNVGEESRSDGCHVFPGLDPVIDINFDSFE